MFNEERQVYNQILSHRHNDLVETTLRWKVITLQCLKEAVKNQKSKRAFERLVDRLEKNMILKSCLNSWGMEKILHPSLQIVSDLAPTLSKEIVEENICHDALVTKLSLALLNYPLFTNIELPHEYRKQRFLRGSLYGTLDPDAILWGKEEAGSFRIAIELELWRKNRDRVYEKMARYANSDFYHFVFYFFAFESAFESYKKRLQEAILEAKTKEEKKALNEKVVLVLEEKLLGKITFLDHGRVYVNEDEKTFKELVGGGTQK